MFTFGKEDVKEGNGVLIFNGGVAGKVEGVTISINKKGIDYQDEGKNKPDYQIVYTDSKGASTNDGVYVLNEKTHNAQYSTFEKAVEKQWNKFAAIITAAGGDPTIQASTPQEMLDKMASLLKSSVVDKSFNVFTNYGTKQSPKKYLQIRSWSPFVESADTNEEDSKLKASNLDQIERIDVATTQTATTVAGGGWV